MVKPDDANQYRRLMQETLVELESLHDQLDGMRRAASEPIAVIGMGCRFPLGANSPGAFWSLLRDGVDAVREIPPQRWDIDAYYDADPDVPGKVYCRHAALVDQAMVEGFSPEFFGIAPREAERMDPQQRMLLEVCWEALEDAALPAGRIRGSRTGVFVGSCTDDYLQLFNNLADPGQIEGYSSLGTARCITVGRVAYLLGLEGPVIQLDTACSSSLVAMHQACASLRSGDCDTALAGGVNLQLSAAWTIGLCKLKALAPDGRCKTFDAAADGFGRGEGCGILVLRRLSDALAAGDPIRALIRGSALNHDGRSGGLTVPSQGAQEKLLRQALHAAGLEPGEIDYLEAHGTGTALGDPIEMGALASVFHNRRQPLWIGSVKTNIGHLEAAAGIAGMIKIILALEHEAIPPHLHFHKPNPYIPWDDLPARIPTGQVPWPRTDRPRLAGVSSFGFSGTNAHVVLQEAPTIAFPVGTQRPCHLLAISAKSLASLRGLAGRYLQSMENDATLGWADVCFTAATGRNHFSHRLAVIAEERNQACRRLRAWLAEEAEPISEPRSRSPGHVAYGEVPTSLSPGPTWPQPADLDPSDAASLAAVAADRYVQGLPIDWESLYHGVDCRKVHLPTYDFERQRYWLPPSRVTSLPSPGGQGRLEHPLLGRRADTAAAPETVLFEAVFRGCGEAATAASPGPAAEGQRPDESAPGPATAHGSTAREPSYLAEHRVGETAVVPATAQLEMALAAGRTLWPNRGLVVENLTLHRALTLPGRESRIVQTLLAPAASHRRFELFSRSAAPSAEPQPWVRHASGRVAPTDAVYPAVSIEALKQTCSEPVPAEAVYDRIARQGLRYGPSFRLLRAAWRAAGQALGEVAVPADVSLSTEGYQFHPALSDACLHVIAALRETDRPATLVPVGLERFELLGRPGPRIWSHATLRTPGDAASASGFTADVEVLDPEGRQVARFQGLRLQEVDPSALASGAGGGTDIGLYQVAWPAKKRSATAAANKPGCWLLLADQQGAAEALARQLANQGHSCVLIQPGDQYHVSRPGPGQIARGSVRPEVPDDFCRAIDDLLPAVEPSAAGNAFLGVVHLWGLSLPGDPSDAFAASHRLGCGSLLHLVQAVTRPGTKARLWLVTRGVQRVEESLVSTGSLAQAPLWGLARVVAVEHPELHCVRIDLDPATAAQSQAGAVLDELLGPDAEDQVAFRQNVRYAARLVRCGPPPEPTQLRPADLASYADALQAGTVLITGGMGRLGLRVAEWLVEHGARHLVLSSRHGPQTDWQQESLDLLRKRGAEVQVVPADLSSRAEVERLLAAIGQSFPRVRGVVHAAGVLDDGALRRLDWPRFEHVLGPKAGGAWHLHELAGELDFFILFSSAVGLLGSPGQGNYAAANAVLDTLAHYRTAAGLPAMSIAWGPWEIGMSARTEGLHARLAQVGIRPIPADAGLRALGGLLAQPWPHVAAMDVDWKRLAQGTPGTPFWAELAPAPAVAHTAPAPWPAQFRHTPPGNRTRLLMRLLCAEVAAVLGWDSADRVGVKQSLFDLGMDSITSVELQSRLEKALGQRLPLTLAFDYPNVEALAGYIARQLNEKEKTPAGQQRRQELPEDARQVAEMSDEQVQALLTERYQHLP